MMQNNFFVHLIQNETRNLFKLKQEKRRWHAPFMAMLTIGIPLLSGYFTGQINEGMLGCLAGLVILYLRLDLPTPQRMLIMMGCSFGFILAFTCGLLFSFNPIISALALGVFTVFIHWTSLYFKLRAPGSFFFIMIAAMSSYFPFDLTSIPTKLGYVTMGTILACTIAMIYSLIFNQNKKLTIITLRPTAFKHQVDYLTQALIIGLAISVSVIVAYLLGLKNPYWIPISCAAIMQGISSYHVWQRAFQRISGTLIGVFLCWAILSISQDLLYLCISAIILQFIIELYITRNYAVAVIFITPLTILLAEASHPIINEPNTLLFARILDITLGSIIGGIGGWFLHHEYLRKQSRKHLRSTRILLQRKFK